MEKYTLRKIGKKLLPVAFGVTAAMVTTNLNTAEAEEIKTDEVKPTTTTEEAIKVKQETVNEAKAELNSAKKNYEKQSSVVENLTARVENKQKEISETFKKTEELKSELKQDKTEEEILTEIESKEVTKSVQEEKVKAENKVLTEMQPALKTASETEQEKLAVVTSAGNDLSKLQEKVQLAENELKAIDKDNVAQELSTAKTSLEEANTQLEAKTKSLEEAKEADETRKFELDAAQTEINSLTTEKTELNTSLDKQKEEIKTEQAEVTRLQKEIDAAVAELNSLNTIILSKEYIENLKIHTDYSKTKEERDAARLKLIEVNDSERANNQFKANPNDNNEVKYDINNLPEDIKKDLSLFASKLVTEIREQVGNPRTIVTQSSLDFATKVTDVYNRDKFDVWESDGHYDQGILEVAKEYGLPEGQYYENWTGNSELLGEFTYARLKEITYNSILNFMFNGQEWYHAQTVSGVNWGTPSEQYLGISFATPTGKDFGGLHLLTVPKVYVDERATKDNFITTEIANTYSAERIEENIKKLNDVFTPKLNNLESLKNELQEATENYNSVLEKLTSAENKYKTALAKEILTPKAQEDFNTAEKYKNEVVKQVDLLEEKYNKLGEEIKEKEANLAKAKAEIKPAEEKLKEAVSEYTTEKTNLEELTNKANKQKEVILKLEQEIKRLNEEINLGKEHIKELKTKQEKVQIFELELSQLGNELFTISDNLRPEKEDLEKLKELLDRAEEKYNKLVQLLELETTLNIFQKGDNFYAIPKFAPSTQDKPELKYETKKIEALIMEEKPELDPALLYPTDNQPQQNDVESETQQQEDRKDTKTTDIAKLDEKQELKEAKEKDNKVNRKVVVRKIVSNTKENNRTLPKTSVTTSENGAGTASGLVGVAALILASLASRKKIK